MYVCLCNGVSDKTLREVVRRYQPKSIQQLRQLVKMVVTLIHPIAMDQGLRFAIREGGRTVGAGVVASVIA
ncbi:hypothetical protein CRX72_28435 [Pantoea sp. BRM17]|nr:hypothetical protein CRX72_28435 [Pantoea sp. BRM17]